MRAEPDYDLEYNVVDREPLIVLMPNDHGLTARETIRPQDFVGEIFIGSSNMAAVVRAITETYLRRSGLDSRLDHSGDNLATVMPSSHPPAVSRSCPHMPRTYCLSQSSAARSKARHR